LDGLEIAWLRSAFETYVVTVQGSARLRLETGELVELGYAGNNGHEYTPISKAMVEDGVIGRDDVSLQTLLQYFAAHPEQTYHYVWKNDRYVFFDQTEGGPYGSLNVPVTPFRSLATDKEVFPRAAVTFLKTDLPTSYEGTVVSKPCSGFALDQDTGGAIRAAGRCDVYMGIGPSAEALAGHTGSEGRLYYIFLRP
jgi:membrane-bound lytic murein transglycosylase A